jgi:hypothetical protein
MPAVVAVAEPSEPKPQTKPSDSEKSLIQPEEVRHFSFSLLVPVLAETILLT